MRTFSYSVESKWPSPNTNAGVSGNAGWNAIWCVVDLPDSYVVYPSLVWPDWPVQQYQHKNIYLSLFIIISQLQVIFYLLNYQYFAFYHYKLSQCCILPLKHYHIAAFYCCKEFIYLVWYSVIPSDSFSLLQGWGKNCFKIPKGNQNTHIEEETTYRLNPCFKYGLHRQQEIPFR